MAVEDYFSALNPRSLLGLDVTATSGPSAAGASLPASSPSTSHGDGGDKPWSPDSPIFWVAVITAFSIAGIVGASVNLHAGPVRAGGAIGK